MPSTLSKQLKIKPAMRIMLLNSPPGYERLLASCPPALWWWPIPAVR